MPLALPLHGRPRALSLSFSQRGNRRTLERELPVFLNLLRVTCETGLNLPQSIKFLNQSLDTSCAHLVQTFAAILDRANATNVPLYDALQDASREIKVDFVADLVTALAVPTTTTEELLSVIDAQTGIAYSLHENKGVRRHNNWAPQLLFLLIFVLQFSMVMLIGPALYQGPVWAIGGPYAMGGHFNHVR